MIIMRYIANLIMVCLIAGFTSCDVAQTKEGDMPEVDVEVTTEAGEMPEYNIDWMDVNIGTRSKMVMVPTVEVVTEQMEVEVPYIDVTWPNQLEDVSDQVIMVEAEIVGTEYDIEIEEVYASNDRLYVISELEKKALSLGNKGMRVSDQVVINAPELAVTHYIIGDKPPRDFNNNYKYIKDRAQIRSKIRGAVKIYG